MARLDSLPGDLQDTATAEALRAICDLDLSEIQSIVPPRGFGWDRQSENQHGLHRWVHLPPRAAASAFEWHSATRGSPLWTTGTSIGQRGRFGRRCRVNFRRRLTVDQEHSSMESASEPRYKEELPHSGEEDEEFHNPWQF
jgi:hypothetical protein